MGQSAVSFFTLKNLCLIWSWVARCRCDPISRTFSFVDPPHCASWVSQIQITVTSTFSERQDRASETSVYTWTGRRQPEPLPNRQSDANGSKRRGGGRRPFFARTGPSHRGTDREEGIYDIQTVSDSGFVQVVGKQCEMRHGCGGNAPARCRLYTPPAKPQKEHLFIV